MSSMSKHPVVPFLTTPHQCLIEQTLESWQQLIRRYCLGKDNGENIMKSINEGPFHIERLRCYVLEELREVLQQRNNARGNVVAGNVGGEQIINFDEDVDNSPENDLALNMDHIFKADECDAFDSDVDRVQDHDTFVNHLDEYHEVHEMQTDEQHNYVVDSDADYTSNSNIIPYDQYVEDNEDHVVQRNVSSVRNDALMSILDEMHEQGVQSRLANKPDMIINDSVASELARYKELVGEYEKRENLN
ncbi:hypothetical protein Tco_0893555 [Tanacetum coccineum]|uniref:Uncharacterized protein n=1 Tax=Tanacetum coccineum TaxID=301880 RepID=A0ABQ5CAH1_9ASTR